ncbi:MAG: cysteine desulfurase family protein [Atopobiaceae bacterium]
MDATKEIYLDYAAATPVDPEVLSAMLPYMTECFYNPSAPYRLARKAKTDYEDARARLAHEIGAKPDNLVICAGATEANNLALNSSQGKILVCATEHESVLAAAETKDHALIPVHRDGCVDMDALERLLTPEVGLVSVSLANGEIGTIQPIRDIAKFVAAKRQERLEAGESLPLWLHTDASQAANALAINVASLHVDMLTLSAAKIYGPKQVGLLWAEDGIAIRPLIQGGGQEGGARSGTENVAGAIGFARALELATSRRAQEARREQGLRDRLQKALLVRFPWAEVAGPKKAKLRLPGLLHISFPGLEARRLVILLEDRGISVGTGSACAASRMRESHVLKAVGASAEVAEGSLRITLGAPVTEEDIDEAAQRIGDCVEAECRRCGLDSATGKAA